MKSLESIGEMRGLISRSLLYWLFGRRLMRRYIRLSFEAARLRRLLLVNEKRHSAALERAVSSLTSEKQRLAELVEAYRTKLEITQAEYSDRLLEAQRMIGVSYATRDATERIEKLSYQPFEVPKQPYAPRRVESPDDLTPIERDSYDAMYQAHVELGRSQGRDDEEIELIWKLNKDDAIRTVLDQYSAN